MKIEMPPQVFASRSGKAPTPRRFVPVTNRRDLHWKPNGGLWTSSLVDGSSDWLRWCDSEGLTDPKKGNPWVRGAWILEPAVAWVCVIRSPEDLADVHSVYGLRELPEPLNVLRMASEILDYEAMARDYDAMWIPSPHPFRLQGGLFFNVMDVESTLWFRWNFKGKPRKLPLAK